MDCKVGFIGFGLIAGSIAHALKESGNNYNIIATSRRLEPVYKAKEDGVVDDVLDCVDDRFANCDFIILCTPVITMNDYLKQLKDIVKSGCIITDVGSVKTSIHNTVKELDMENVFIGGHPMAGSELTGYANSSSAIMKNARDNSYITLSSSFFNIFLLLSTFTASSHTASYVTMPSSLNVFAA